MKSLNDSAAALIPFRRHENLLPCTVEDLVSYGEAVLRDVIRCWRHQAKELAGSMRRADEKFRLLQGKSAEDIRKIAGQYENPEFPLVSFREGMRPVGPEPLDTASINRKPGATTFNVCGWCKYAVNGSVRHDYYIDPECDIRRVAGLKGDKYHFNTPCFLKKASRGELGVIRAGLARQLDSLIEKKREADKNIRFLLSLEKQAEKKPAMPYFRPQEWFNEGDSVVGYIEDLEGRIVKDAFVSGKIVNGYRHGDGTIFVCYDRRIHTGSNLGGYGTAISATSSAVMHEWEFEYLLEHPEFARTWAKKGVDDPEEGHVDQLLNAFAQEAVRRNLEKQAKQN